MKQDCEWYEKGDCRSMQYNEKVLVAAYMYRYHTSDIRFYCTGWPISSLYLLLKWINRTCYRAIVKQFLGLKQSCHCHHNSSSGFKNQFSIVSTISFFSRIFDCDSLTTTYVNFSCNCFLNYNKAFKGTILSRVLKLLIQSDCVFF